MGKVRILVGVLALVLAGCSGARLSGSTAPTTPVAQAADCGDCSDGSLLTRLTVVREAADPCAPCPTPAKVEPQWRTRVECCNRGYFGGHVSMVPGIGFGLEGGYIVRRSPMADIALELAMPYQDLYHGILNNEKDTGKTIGGNIGVKMIFRPECNGHPILRGGFGWRFLTEHNRSGDVGKLDEKGEYFGGYLSLGYEWDIGKSCNSRGWSTGPSVDLWGGLRSFETPSAWTAGVSWHLVKNF